MRQMDEKSTDQEVSLMVWSPKMDILALAFDTGCLSLYRLQWQKIWTAEGSVEGEGALKWECVTKMEAHNSGVLAMAGCEGCLLTAASRSIKMWDLETKKLIT